MERGEEEKIELKKNNNNPNTIQSAYYKSVISLIPENLSLIIEICLRLVLLLKYVSNDGLPNNLYTNEDPTNTKPDINKDGIVIE